MKPVRTTLTPQSDADGICASQTPAGAGNLTIDGALASSGAVTLNNGHLITITCAGDETARTFTVTGTNDNGYTITEDITGVNASTAEGAKYFKTVTQISVDAATAGAVTAGVNGKSATRIYPTNQYLNPFSIGFGCVVSGTLTYTVQHTFDDVQVEDSSSLDVFNHDSIAAQTSSQDGNYAFPMSGLRVIVTAFTSGTLDFNFIQAG